MASRKPIQDRASVLSGKSGGRIAGDLASYSMGAKALSALSPAFDRAEDGTLRLTVDAETFEALGLRVR